MELGHPKGMSYHPIQIARPQSSQSEHGAHGKNHVLASLC